MRWVGNEKSTFFIIIEVGWFYH